MKFNVQRLRYGMTGHAKKLAAFLSKTARRHVIVKSFCSNVELTDFFFVHILCALSCVIKPSANILCDWLSSSEISQKLLKDCY